MKSKDKACDRAVHVQFLLLCSLKELLRSLIVPHGKSYLWSHETHMMSISNRDQPLRLLFPGLDPVVDVVAIHGLNPLNHQDHELRTWEKNGNLWLRDNFKLVFPKARTLLYVYNSSPAFGSNRERFVHEANELLERLRIGRRKVLTLNRV